jgi:hypothetical protein
MLIKSIHHFGSFPTYLPHFAFNKYLSIYTLYDGDGSRPPQKIAIGLDLAYFYYNLSKR